MKNIVTIFIMVVGVVVFSNCSGRITELRGCSFEPEQLVSEIMQEYDADSVSITYRRFRLEPCLPLIKTPVVEIFNPRMKSLDFKTLDMTMRELDKLDEEIHLRDSLKKELKPIAERIVNGCNTRRYNNLIIDIRKVNVSGKKTHQFVFSYEDILDIKRTRIPYDKPSADAELYLKLRQQ